MTKGRQPKYTVKDTVFRDMFSDKKYLIQLYQALHTDDTAITKDDLDIVTLQSILMNGIYNDLGFMVRGNQLMILVEAQSTWSANIIVRSLIYLMSTYQDYFTNNKIQLYGSKKADMPKPELYVIYTGEKEHHPDILSLKDEFFPDTDCCIDAKVKIIYLSDSDDIINQYIGFCRVFNEQVALHGRTLTAAKEIIRICRDRNLLTEYLSEREKEVEDIMLTLFDQEKIWNIERDNIRAAALADGISQGISQGAAEKEQNMIVGMLKENVNINTIAKVAQMTVEQVAAIGKKAAVL